MSRSRGSSLTEMWKKLNFFNNTSKDSVLPAMPLISTAPDKSMIHNMVDVYGTSIAHLTGNITIDVGALFYTKYNLADGANDTHHFTYKSAIIADKNFDNRNQVATIDGNNKTNNKDKNKNKHKNKEKNNESKGSKNKLVSNRCSEDELKFYKLVNDKNYWRPQEQFVKGAQLIERHWRRVFMAKNSNINTSNGNGMSQHHLNDGFTIMQFNMLADGLSNGYTDSSDKTQKMKKIDDKTWFDKCEKCFLRVNPLCLQWRCRGLRLIEEILRFECDLVAIEECDQPEWMYELYLKYYGYKMMFVEKSDSPCAKLGDMFINSKNKPQFEVEQERFNNTLKLTKEQKKNFRLKNDGCLVLYKDKFKLLSTISPAKSSNKNAYKGIGKKQKQKQKQAEQENIEIVEFKTADEIYDWQQFCLGKINDSKLLPWLEKKWVSAQEFVSMKCSVTCDLIDLDEKIYDEKDGTFLGYGKLNVLDVKKSKKAGKDVFKKAATTFIALHMKHMPTSKQFIFVTTHLKSSKDAAGEKMRVGQMQAMFGYGPYREINVKDGVVNKPQPIIHNPNNLPIILCCDMNAKPHDTMKLDKSLNKMVKDYGHECYSIATSCSNIDSKSDEKENDNNDTGNGNNGGLGFESLYYVALGNKEPKYTTWKERRNEENVDSKSGDVAKHTIDYIFKKDVQNELGITHFLEIPDIDENTQLGKALLPDWHYPSDHFSLAMRLQWNIKR